MADGTLLFKTAIDESGLVKGLNGVKGAAHTAFGVSAKAAKAMTATVTAGAGAVSALSVSAVKSYAEYEQLVGGVETLFKDSNNIVMEYAANAYETAGMSANSYMETVTSFSASLLQGLGGDTKQAAEIANLAVTDMSDNANKMGTDISSIQDAYQGFAKQNYTMLDNLKLGYGGTQTEMIRLINDSGILEEKIDSLDNITFDQMIQAIHAVQTDMGITGTTALEASTTIEGSVNSAKAAWSNLVTGIADDNQNFDELVNNFVDSVAIAADNLLPRIEIGINGIGILIETLLPIIVNRIPIILNGVLPDLIQAGINMINSLVEGVEQNLPQIMNAGVSILSSLIDGIITCIPLLGSLAYNVITTLLEGIEQNLPQIMDTGKRLVDGFLKGISESFPGVGSFLQGLFNGVSESLEPIIDGLVSRFSKLFDTFNDADPDKMYKVGKAIGEIAVAIGTIKISKSTITLTRDLFKALKGNSFIGTVGKVVEGFQLFAGGAGTLSEVLALEFPVISTAISSMSGWASIAGGALTSLGGTITSGISSIVGIIGGPLLIAIAAAIAAVIALICNWDEVKNFFTETLPAWWENTVVPFFSELGEKFIIALNAFGEKAVDFLKSCLDHVVEFFDELPYKIGYALGVLIGKIIQFGVDFWGWVTTELPNIIAGIIEWFKTLPERVWEWLLNTIAKIITWGGEMQKNGKEAVKRFLEKVIETIKELPGETWEWLKKTAGKVVDWKEDMKKKAKDAMSAFSENVQEAIKDLPEKIKECGINIVKGFVDGVKEKYAWMKEQVNGFFGGVVAGVEDTLDEHSPSRVFKKIGVFSAKGYVLGWKDVPIDKQVSANMKNSIGTIQANLKGTGTTMKTQQGIDYSRMGQAMAYAMERSGFKLTIGQREFGRIVREVMA